MMKSEFETQICKEITQEEWELVHCIYQWHPVIKDVGGKQQMKQLYEIGGMTIFEDMKARALLVSGLEDQIQNLENRASILRGRRNRLAVGPVPREE